MKKWYETYCQNVSGFLKPAVGVSVAIYEAGSSNLAVIYQDDGSTPKTNPLTTDANGFVSANLNDGRYDIVATQNTVELQRISGVVVADFDPDNVNINGGTINGAVIGGTTPAQASFTDISYSGELHGGGA